MSNGDKKPGLRDIRSLREKLGMLQKDGASPSDRSAVNDPSLSPTPDPAARQDLVNEPDALAGADTAVSRVSAGEDITEASPTDSPRAPAAPAAPVGAGGFDVFNRVDDTSQSASSGEAASTQNAQFANPLQVGSYVEPAASVNLTQEEEAGLEDYQNSQKGMKLSLALGMTLGVALITLVFGFLIGDVRNARRMINAQIDSSVRVNQSMQGLLESYDSLKPIINSLKKGELDFERVAKIPKDLPTVDAGGIMNSPVPLNPELNRHLSNFIGDLNTLFSLAGEHRKLTLGRDRAELEGLMSGNDFSKHRYFAIVYTPVEKRRKQAYRPPNGRLVALTGKAVAGEKKGEFVVPTVSRSGKEAMTNYRNLIAIEKSEFLPGGKANALTQFDQRIDYIRAHLQKMMQYEALFRDVLKEQAQRDKVFSI